MLKRQKSSILYITDPAEPEFRHCFKVANNVTYIKTKNGRVVEKMRVTLGCDIAKKYLVPYLKRTGKSLAAVRRDCIVYDTLRDA